MRGRAGRARTGVLIVDELLALIESPNPAVAASAVKALGALRVESAYARIIRLLDREYPDSSEVHDAVKTASIG